MDEKRSVHKMDVDQLAPIVQHGGALQTHSDGGYREKEKTAAVAMAITARALVQDQWTSKALANSMEYITGAYSPFCALLFRV